MKLYLCVAHPKKDIFNPRVMQAVVFEANNTAEAIQKFYAHNPEIYMPYVQEVKDQGFVRAKITL